MHSLSEIEVAADALTPDEKKQLLRFLSVRILSGENASTQARVIYCESDVLLEAPADAPDMTPEQVKQILEEWP